MTTYGDYTSLYSIGRSEVQPTLAWVGRQNVLQAAQIDGHRNLFANSVIMSNGANWETAVGRPAIESGPTEQSVLLAWAGTDGSYTMNMALSEPLEPGKPPIWREKILLPFSGPQGVSLASGYSGRDVWYIAWTDGAQQINLAWSATPLVTNPTIHHIAQSHPALHTACTPLWT